MGSTYKRQPAFESSNQSPRFLRGRFLANGSSAVTDFSGDVTSVTRLVDGSANPFFRIKLKSPLRSNDVIHITCGLADVSDDLSVGYARTPGFTASPANPITGALEFDIMIKDAGTAVDTADIEVSFLIFGSEAQS